MTKITEKLKKTEKMVRYKSSLENANPQQGQVLLFVIIAMTIALALGIGVSTQTITTLTGVSDTDVSQRVLAVAEGGAEAALSLSDIDLDSWVTNASSAATLCSTKLNGVWGSNLCVVSYPPSANDNIEASAEITISRLVVDVVGITSFYDYFAEDGQVREIRLDTAINNGLEVCWNENNDIGLYYIVYNTDGDMTKNLVACNSGGGECPTQPPGVQWKGDFEQSTYGTFGYSSCYQIPTGDMPTSPNAKGIRIYTLGGDTNVGVRYLNPGNILPAQGYKITSRGELSDPTAPTADISKTVTVLKSYPYLPGMFDFALFSEAGLDAGDTPIVTGPPPPWPIEP